MMLDITETDQKSQTDDHYNMSIGRIVSISGSQAIMLLEDNASSGISGGYYHPDMGSLLKIATSSSVILGMVSALSIPAPNQHDRTSEIKIVELELTGEISKDEFGTLGSFRRGITVYPALGDQVQIAGHEELARAYAWDSGDTINIGTIHQDSTIPVMVRTDELLGKHFAVLGTTGTGKSCAVALIMRQILHANPQAHILLIDPHNEYRSSFGSMAEIVTTSNLQLPFWLLTFEEIVAVILGNKSDRKEEVEILMDLIPMAKARYAIAASHRGRGGVAKASLRTDENANYSIDAPLPYRISDLLDLLNDRMGRLEVQKSLGPYKHLKQRIESIIHDTRYNFMFGSLTVQDHMSEILGRLLRIPVDGRPITILEMTGLPPEVINIVVSVLARMVFDFALWSNGKVPVTLICEEAHRYIPSDRQAGFEPTRRSIAKIAKEGRKYGVSLCIVSQRPGELDTTIMSQCNTIFAMRMANEMDQKIVEAAISDMSTSMIEFLPLLGTAQAIVFGDGVTMPVRINFSELSKDDMPRGTTAKFSQQWRIEIDDPGFLDNVVAKWREAGSPNQSAEFTDADNSYRTEMQQYTSTQQETPEYAAFTSPQYEPYPDMALEPETFMEAEEACEPEPEPKPVTSWKDLRATLEN